MNRQAIVIASFGTSVPEARASITAIENTLTTAAVGYTSVRAFTSPTIRRILNNRGDYVPSLADALEHLLEKGVRKVIVQPTHLLYGYEYDKLEAEAEAFADRFETVIVGRPLLADHRDILRFAEHLAEDCPAEEGMVTVFMGHGTEHFANAAYPALQTAFQLLGRSDIYIGTVEGWPALDDILRQLNADGPKNIRLLPLMLAAGDHARNDMAGEWKTRLENAGHSVACSFTGLGQLNWVQDMYREHLSPLL